MLTSILSWLGWVLCLMAFGICATLFYAYRKSNKQLEYLQSEFHNTLHRQQGMTFKFRKIDGRFIHTFCDGELSYKLGASPEAVVGSTLSDFLNDEQYIKFKESYYERAWQGEEVSYEGMLNGIWYIASLSPVYVNGMVYEVIASCVNITQQKLVESELRENEQMYRLIAETSADLIRILKTDMTIRYASPSHLDILGYTPSEIEGIPCIELVLPEERERVARAFHDMVSQKSRYYQINFHAVHKDGSIVMLETHGKLVLDDNGLPTGVVVVSRDLTKRQKQDEEHRRREKLSLAGQLAAGIAHEIRNPLTAIKGFTRLLRTPSDRQGYYAEVIALELARVESIVNEFLLLAKPEAVEFQGLDLSLVLTDVITLLGPQATLENVQIHLQNTPNQTMVFGVASQLKQVFVNLIKNASESMPDGGNVYVRVEVDGEHVITSVIDEGCGIPEESISRLGEPFYTTKERGTGLGLMVSYKIVKDHGGNITVRSTFGQGTCIEIALPLLPKRIEV